MTSSCRRFADDLRGRRIPWDRACGTLVLLDGYASSRSEAKFATAVVVESLSAGSGTALAWVVLAWVVKSNRMSSRIRYRHGTSTKIIPVAKRIPKPNEIAIGMMYWACRESSKISGIRPPKVVNVVNKMGRKRRTPAGE